MAMRWDSRHLTEDELERSYEDVYYPVNDVGGSGGYGMGGVDDLQPPVGDAPSPPPPQPPASVPPPPVTPDQYEKLAGQIKRSWEAGGVGDSIVGVSTQDRANALAQQLAQRGVRDLEKLSVGSIQRYTGVDAREPAGKVVDWSTYRGAPFETYSFLQYDGKPIGYIANSPSDTSVKADPFDKSGAGVLDLWDPAGKGHLKFIPTASGPGGLLSFAPKWASSSDLPGEVVAALGIALTVSGVGAALGSAITSGLGIGASASVNALIGNTVMQTVLNGGDIESAVKGSLASYVGAQVGEFVGKAAGSFFSNPEGIRLISNVANQATRATILGQDVESAIKNTVVAGAVDFATAKIPGFNDLPNAVKDTVKQSINAALQGKDVDVGTMLANAAKEGILSYGLNQIPEFKSADARTQSFISTMLRTALDQGDLTQSAINWAIGQAQQEFQKTIKAGPALDELKKAGLIPEASYFGLDDKMKTLVDQFVQQKDPKAAASTYINSLSTTDEEIRKFYKELTGRDPTDEDKDLLARFTGPLDEATARTGLDNQIRANESADRLRFDELNKVLTNPKATEGDLANAMSQYGITPAFIERVTGRKYDEIKTDLTPKPPTTTTEPSGTTGTTTTGGDFVEAGSGVTGTTGATTGAATGAGEFSYGNLNIKHENQRKAAEIIRQELGDAVFSDPKFVDYLNQGGLNAAAGNVFAGSENHLRDQLRLMKSGQQVSLGLPKDALTRQLAAGYDIGDYKAPSGFFVAEPGEALADIGYTEAGVPVNLGQRVEVTGKYLPTAGGELSKNIMDAVKGTWLEAPSAMGLGAVGELGQAFSGGASWFFNLPPSHSLNRTFNEINAAAETGVPQDVKDQWKNWQNNVGKAEGFWGTIWAGMKNAPDNFKGILWETGKEILQELPMLGAGLLVRGTAAGLALAEKVAARLGVGVATALEMIENGGAAYNDAMGETLKRLDPLVKEGKITREEQLYMAHNNAGQAFLSGAGITGVISRVPGGNSLIEQIVGASRLTGAANLAQAISTAVSTGAKSSIKEFFSEGIESGLTSASTQYAVTGKVNPQQAAYEAITGAIIGKFTTGTLSTLDSLKSNLETAYSGQSRDTVIGINPSTGQDITLGQTLQALDTKRQELGGKVEPPLGDVKAGTTSGADTTAGAAAGAGTTTGGTTAGTTAGTTTGAGTTVGTGGTTTGGTTAPVGIDGDITIGGGGDRGAVTADTGAATGTTVGVATDTSEQAAAAFDPKTLFAGYTDPGDPNAFGRQDIEQLITLGATPEQIRSIANEFSSRGMPVGPAAQNWLATGSFETASAAGTSAGGTTTVGTGAATTTGGAGTTTGGTAEATVGGATTTGTTAGTTAGTATAGTGATTGTTAGTGTAATTGATAGTTTGGITTAGTTAGTTTGTTAGTTTGATTGTATAGTAGGTTVAGLTQDDVLNIVNSVFAKNPSLSIDQVKSVVESTIAANPGLKMADVNQAITNALSKLPASVSPTQMQEAINSAVTSITSGQITSADVTNIVNNALAANPGLKIADVQSVVNQAIAGLPAGLSMADVNTAISNALKTLPATVSPAGMKSAIDAAVADIRGSQLTQADVTTIVNNALAANPGLKVADVQAVVNSAIAGLPAGLSMADVNTAITNALKTLPAGVTPDQMQAAIGSAVSGLGTSVAGQIGDLKNSLTAALNDAKAQGLQGDNALQAGLDKVAADLGTTRGDLLAQMGTTEQALRSEFSSQIGGVQTQVSELGDSLRAAIAEARSAGLDGDAALQVGLDSLASRLGTTRDDLLSTLGATEQTLRTEFASQLGGVQTQVTQLGDSLRDAIAEARAAGLQGDAALQAGIDKVAGDLGTTRESLLSQLGTTEQTLRSDFASQLGTATGALAGQIGDVETRLLNKINAAQQSGLKGDAALQSAINSVAADLGTTKDALLGQIGQTEQSLRTQFETALGGVQTQVQQQATSLSNIDARIDTLMQQGLDARTATQRALDELSQTQQQTSTQLSQRIDTLTQQGMDTQAATQKAINELSQTQQQTTSRIDQRIDELMKSGLDQNTATQQAINELGTQITTTQAQTQSALTDVNTRINQLMQQGVDYQTATRTAIGELGGGLGALGAGFQAYVTSQEQQREQDRAAQQQAQQRAQSQQGIQQALTALGVGAAAAPVADYYAKFKDPFMTKMVEQKFVSPLESYLQEMRTPFDLDQQFGADTTKQPDRIQQEEEPMDYFYYGKIGSIDDILRVDQTPPGGLLSFRRGGVVPAYAGGGSVPLYAGGGALNVVHFAGKPRIDFRHGSAVHGPGDGQSDDIPAMLADGEYVFDAETVSALGNGSTKAGAKVLDEMRLAIRKHKRSGPLDTIPPPSKSPLEYLNMSKKGKK